MSSVWNELKRRKVVKVALVYVVAGWLLAQVAEFATGTFGAPDWVLQIFVVFLVLGLPLAIILAWAFDITPDGIKKTDDIDAVPPSGQPASSKLNIAFVGTITIALGAVAWLQFSDVSPLVMTAGSTRQQHDERAVGHGHSQHFDLAFADEAPLAFIGPATLGNGRQAFAISPDGTRMVYVGDQIGAFKLFLRELDGHDVQALPGTEDAYGPFFSPNSEWIGFFVRNELRKLRLDGGDSIVLAEATNSVGAAWTEQDEIVFVTQEGRSLMRVAAQGGVPETLDDQLQGAFPSALPGNSGILLERWSTNESSNVVLDPGTGEFHVLPIESEDVRYAGGFLFYSVGSNLYAAHFDPVSKEIDSAIVPVLTGLRVEVYGAAQWSVSNTGTLLYAPGTRSGSNPFHWVVGSDSTPLDLPVRERSSFEISPDGQHLAVFEYVAGASDVWLYELATGRPRKLTIDGQADRPIFWMPDGKSLIYHKQEGLRNVPYRHYIDSGDLGEPLLQAEYKGDNASSVSADGRYLALQGATSEIAVVDLTDNTEVPVPTIGDDNWGAAISPDGRAVVYTSSESGGYQNYLQPLPVTGDRFQVSRTSGAEEPRWSEDGSHLYYRSGNRIMVVAITTHPELRIGEPQIFFAGEFENVSHRSYDVHPDGRRSLVIRGGKNTASSIRVVTNWFSEVERLVWEEEGAH